VADLSNQVARYVTQISDTSEVQKDLALYIKQLTKEVTELKAQTPAQHNPTGDGIEPGSCCAKLCAEHQELIEAHKVLLAEQESLQGKNEGYKSLLTKCTEEIKEMQAELAYAQVRQVQSVPHVIAHSALCLRLQEGYFGNIYLPLLLVISRHCTISVCSLSSLPAEACF
jgi:Mg2+ and Co2+ transporter CorA